MLYLPNDIISGAQDDEGNDLTTIENKIEAAQAYSDEFLSGFAEGAEWTVADDRSAAVDLIANVEDSEQSVTDATAEAANIVDQDIGDDADTSLSGQVLVDGQAATSIPTDASTLTVGDDTSGSAALNDGQTRTFTSDNFDNVEIAAQNGSSGSLSLDGAGTDIVTAGTINTVQVGRRGEGDLTVENGAGVSTLQFGVGVEGDGSATIRGQDSKVTASNDNGLMSGDFSFQSGFVRVARKPGSTGDLEIREGGELEIRPGNAQNSDTSGPLLLIGQELDSKGDVTVDGAGSKIEIFQDSPIQNFGPALTIGDGLGQGDLIVSNGGSVDIDGPSTSLTVSVANPNQADDTSDTSQVEESTLTIKSGGQVNLTADETSRANFAPRQGSDATVTITGEGSQLSLSGGSGGYGGLIDIGQAGTADVNITDGGRMEGLYVATGGANVPAGASPGNYNTGGTGNITVDGSGSELVLSGSGNFGYGAFLTVGRTGTGSLDVTNGGTVSIKTQDGTFPGFTVGDAQGADGSLTDGSLTIDGDNSLVEVSGEQGAEGDGGYAGFIEIGDENGTGTLTVQNGGTLRHDELGAMFVGIDGSNSDGTVTVTGNGSTLEAGDQLIIGGNFENDQVVFDAPGTGSVTVENGATLTAGQSEGDGETDIFVGSDGSLQVASDATLTGDVQTDAGGVFAMGNSPGLAIVQGDFDAGGDTTFELDGTQDGEFDQIDVAGDATLGGDVTFDFGGGFTPEVGDAFTILDAEGAVALAGDLDVGVEGLPNDLGIGLDAGGGTIVATVVDSADPDALA